MSIEAECLRNYVHLVNNYNALCQKNSELKREVENLRNSVHLYEDKNYE